MNVCANYDRSCSILCYTSTQYVFVNKQQQYSVILIIQCKLELVL